VLSASLAATKAQHQLFVPDENAAEAARPKDAHIYGVKDLASLCQHLSGEAVFSQAQASLNLNIRPLPDLIDVKGQHRAKPAIRLKNNTHQTCRFFCCKIYYQCATTTTLGRLWHYA